MKLLIFPLIIIALMLMAGCNLGGEKKVREFIPGTYITEWGNGFSSARDTILLKAFSDGGSDGYSITRRTTYTQLVKGRILKPRYKIARWTGSFNTGDRTVIIAKTGRVLSFDPDKNEMRMGPAIYKKL